MAIVVDVVGDDGRAYALDCSRVAGRIRWTLVIVSRSDKAEEAYPLDYDKRHQRFFLSAKDQKRVGVGGLAGLERLARAALPRRR